jgi:hypothetical protein
MMAILCSKLYSPRLILLFYQFKNYYIFFLFVCGSGIRAENKLKGKISYNRKKKKKNRKHYREDYYNKSVRVICVKIE